MNLDWDAKKYSTDFSYVHEYGADLLDLIDGRGGRVLDLGCGNGALTRKLSEAGFRAEGMDNSESLLCAARASYPELPFFLGDAADFHPEEPYDIVFSNAVFHWIPRERQRDMLRCIYGALHRHGQLVFEMGGSGNVRKILGALRDSFHRHERFFERPFFFPTIGQYTALLEQAGFQVRYAVLFERPTTLKGDDGMYDWLNMFCNTPLSTFSPEEKEIVLRETVEALRPMLCYNGKWAADYVRLRCRAIRL